MTTERDLFAEATVPAAGPAVIELGTCPADVRWQITRVAAFAPAAPGTAIAGTFAFVCTGGTPGTFDPTTVAMILGPLPDSDNWTRTVWAQPGERVSVAIFGAGAGTVLAATAGVIEEGS